MDFRNCKIPKRSIRAWECSMKCVVSSITCRRLYCWVIDVYFRFVEEFESIVVEVANEVYISDVSLVLWNLQHYCCRLSWNFACDRKYHIRYGYYCIGLFPAICIKDGLAPGLLCAYCLNISNLIITPPWASVQVEGGSMCHHCAY